MTVLQSLLSNFRRSRSKLRKPRRAQAQAARQSNASCESLEARLLLTNPIQRDSLPGAPVTIYLDFDGHTETDAEWVQQTTALTPFDTPAFGFDADGTNFTQAETDSIEEIYLRVAEDFRPFNINITTVSPTAPLVNGVDLLVSVGGSGDWDATDLNRFNAIEGSFSTAGLPQTAFAFQTPHDGLGGDFEQNMAASVSQTIAVAMGLQVHRLTAFDAPLEGDASTAPILGDQIVGIDTVLTNFNSLRDIWFNAPVSATTTQDDLDVITDPNTNGIVFRLDDHQDDIGGATLISIGPNDDEISGIIETNTDVDVFRFSTLDAAAVITVKGLDLTTQFPGVTNPGSNLDPVLELLDATGAVLATHDAAAAFDGDPISLTATISENLPAGTYFIRVSNRSEYGNLGEYTVTLQGVDGDPVTIEIDPETFSENDGVQVGVGIARRPVGQAFGAPILIELESSDTSELTVPATVTIPAGAASADFNVTIVDDDILDGDQRVSVRATVTGVINSTAFVTVTDHETVSINVLTNPVQENAGTVSVEITRSNTDIDAPNHWVTVNNELLEYSPDGVLVQTIPIEWPTGVRPAGETAHDVIVLEDGRVAIYNGSVNAALSIYNLTTRTWNHVGPIAGLSGSPTDASVGGIAAIGDYIFLTDFESFDGDSHGMVRIDITTGQVTRFGEGTLGARLFSMVNSTTSQLFEFNAADGSLVNTLDLPLIPGRPFRYTPQAIAFDGSDLWVLVPFGGGFTQQLIKIDADTGELLEEHNLVGSQNAPFLDGIAVLDGLIYLSSQFGVTTFSGLEVEVYDPVLRRTTGQIITPSNGFDINRSFGQYIGAVPSEGSLLITDDTFGFPGFGASAVRLLDPASGLITGTVSPSNTFGSDRGVTSVSDVVFGSTPLNDLIYVSTSSNTIDVFTLAGVPVDTDPTTPAIDPLTTPVAYFGDLTGGDVPGVTFSDLRFRDVTIGFDGLLYGLVDTGDKISVHDPETLARIRGIDLDTMVTTIAVGDASGIYAGGANGVVIQFDLNGITQSVLNSNLGQIVDIEVNIGQEVLISDVTGNVVLTTQAAIITSNLALVTPLETVSGLPYVSFGRHPSRSTGNLAVTLTSSDVSELAVPTTVVIPRGQQSITVDITVVDDNERDGDQVVTITAESPEYVSGSDIVTVTDVEEVGVDVLPLEVSEASGVTPGIVRVFRTDIDGPFTFASTINQSVTAPQPIADNATTISQIELEDQISFITDLNVTLSIVHDAIPDLDVFLISPQGTRVELFTDLSSNESNLTNTTFDDQASVRIVDAMAPFTGRFIPEEFLANFTGENPSGTWSLEVIDDSVTDAGILFNWSLEIATIGLQELTVTLSSDDTTEADVPVTVTIPRNQSEVFLPLEAFDDDDIDGTQTVTISVDSVELTGGANADGFGLTNDTVDVTDSETLTFTLNQTVISEGAGTAALSGTISRLGTTGDLTVTLTSSDTSELTVSNTVTIPDGATFVDFTADAQDDSIFDGDQQVTITAEAPGHVDSFSPIITVQDQEPRLQLSTLSPIVSEDSGTVTFTVTRRDVTDLLLPQTVILTSSDLTELTVPASVVIPAGEASMTFLATAIEDADLDGTQVVTITASDSNVATPTIDSATFDISVQDAEFVSLTVPTGEEFVLENAGVGAVTVTVGISSAAHTSPIIVTLSNSDLTELSIPESVVIPVGSDSTTFLLNVLDDPQLDRDQIVNLTGSVPGYLDGVLSVTVGDHEPPTLIGPTLNTLDPTPVFAWAAVDGATRYDLWVNDVSRNITQLFRLENLESRPALFRETFEAVGGFDESGWVPTNVDVDGLGLNVNGSASAHLNGNPDGDDALESRTIDLSAEFGAQLTYSYQRTGSLESPGPGQDLILQYRNADGAWVQLERQLGVGEDMTVFQTSVVTLPQAALHPDFAFRFITFGDPTATVPDGETAPTTVDDWFVDDVILAGHETFEPVQELGVGQYRFWVRAYDDLELPTAWSSARNFSVRTAPVFTSPIANTTIAETTFPEISWESVVDTANYDLWIDSLTTGESQIVRQETLQTTSFASATENLPGGTYRAWVRAIAPDLDPNDDIDPVAGQWSSSITFTVLSTPQVTSPTGATFDTTPEITWNAVEGATNYDVWVTLRRGPNDSTIVLRDQFVSGTSRTPETDFEPGNYVVWVRAIAADGLRSQWSTAVTFTVGGRPVVNPPITDVTPIIISWEGIDQTDFYEIWINNSAGERVVLETNIQATSYAITPDLPADSYRVWVRATSDMGERSFWSTPVTFVVATNDNTGPQNTDLADRDTLLTRFSPAKAVIIAEPATMKPVTVEPETPELVVSEIVAADAAVVEPQTHLPEAVDSVMAEWDGANWWDTDASKAPAEDSSLAAAAVGFIALGTSARPSQRRRRTNR